MSTDRDPFHGMRTERLVLRRLTAADAGAFAAYRADPAVARYQSWSDYTLSQAQDLIAGQQPLSIGQVGAWCQIGFEDQRTGALIGDCAFHILDDDPRQAEIGATMAPAYQRQGHAREGCGAVLDYAFRELQLHRVQATVDVLNESAIQLLDRLRFRREAHFVENIWFKGSWGSEYQYAILRREWMSEPR